MSSEESAKKATKSVLNLRPKHLQLPALFFILFQVAHYIGGDSVDTCLENRDTHDPSIHHPLYAADKNATDNDLQPNFPRTRAFKVIQRLRSYVELKVEINSTFGSLQPKSTAFPKTWKEKCHCPIFEDVLMLKKKRSM